MGGIKLKIHPLFYPLGLYYAITGRIFIFIVYTVTAVVHELGHSLVAGEKGYRLNKITLMPFGAVVTGDLSDMDFKDEISIAIAGPMVNLLVALFFIASWWIFPETYAVTDMAVSSCLSMALINCLPAYPLDGGRVLSAFLSLKMGRDKAQKVCKVLGVVFAILFFALFILTIFKTVNFSVLFFALFILSGALNSDKEAGYIRIYNGVSVKKLKKGVVVKKIAIEKSTTVKRLLSLLDADAINEVDVYDGEKKVYTLSQENIKKIMEKGELSSCISKHVGL